MSSKIQILRRDTRQRGATIVEFSLVFLLFVVILVALMEFGRAMWTYAMIAHATRQAGRYCMVHGTEKPGHNLRRRASSQKALLWFGCNPGSGHSNLGKRRGPRRCGARRPCQDSS